MLTDKNGQEIRSLFPINNNSDNLFRNTFNKNSMNLSSQLNYIGKNYRPKCDICSGICDFEWFSEKINEKENNSNGVEGMILENGVQKPILLCSKCYETERYPKELTKTDFEFSNFYTIVAQINKGNLSFLI